MKRSWGIFLLVLLILSLFLINYSFLDKTIQGFLIQKEAAFVNRIIDGDTVEINNKTSVRLLGINSPEKGEAYYQQAKSFLGSSILNKTVYLEFGKDKYDKYGRTLAYIFLGNENINLKAVEKGFANFYFPSAKDIYYNKFVKAWEKCIEKNEKLCEMSKDRCADCIILEKLDAENQDIIFYNNCDFPCNLNGWEIKDEGRKKFKFEDFVLQEKVQVEIRVGEGTNTKDILFWEEEDYVWTKTGDTLFLRDGEGKLVLWENYS